MKILSRGDVISAVVTGATTGIIAWRILAYLGSSLPVIRPGALAILLPILWPLGVQLGYVLGALWKPMTQFGRFVAIGFANASIDFGVLYLLIGYSGNAEGIAYAAFKTMSFTVATVHSYFWNKYWTFAAHTAGGRGELARFVGVSVAAVLVNVAIASAVVLLRPGTFDPHAWAGVGAIAGSAAALAGSFIGFRLFVFGKKV